MTFEEYLQEQHIKGYIGSKDNAVEDYEKWIVELEVEDWLYYGDLYGTRKALRRIL